MSCFHKFLQMASPEKSDLLYSPHASRSPEHTVYSSTDTHCHTDCSILSNIWPGLFLHTNLTINHTKCQVAEIDYLHTKVVDNYLLELFSIKNLLFAANGLQKKWSIKSVGCRSSKHYNNNNHGELSVLHCQLEVVLVNTPVEGTYFFFHFLLVTGWICKL